MPPGDFSNKNLSNLYDEFRPSYPECIVDTIVSACRQKWSNDDVTNMPSDARIDPLKQLCAIDVACGTGIFTRLLSPHFGRVIGVDLSATQIEVAKKVNQDSQGTYDNITYFASGAFNLLDILRDLNLTTDQVCLITIAEALHWLDIPKFCNYITSNFSHKVVFSPVAYPYPDFMHQGLETPGFTLINPEMLCDSYDDENRLMDQYFRDCVSLFHHNYLGENCWMGNYFKKAGFEDHFKNVEFTGFSLLQWGTAFGLKNLLASLSRYHSYVNESEGNGDPAIELMNKLLDVKGLTGLKETEDFSSERDEQLLKGLKFQLRWKYFCYALSN